MRRRLASTPFAAAMVAVAVAVVPLPHPPGSPADTGRVQASPHLAVVEGPATVLARAVRLDIGLARALDVLATIRVENEQPAGYDRDLFGYPTTIENNCDTRATVLRRDSLTPAQVDPFGCAVVAGDWYSAYDDRTWDDPGEVQIDHVVALKEAWDSGAFGWTAERRRAFANDLLDDRTLAVVTGSVNASKGASDPSNWLPPHAPYVCTYLADWISIKARWSLSMDASEHGRIRNLLTDRCPNQRVAPWPATPPPPPPPPPPTTPPPPPPAGNCDPSYPTVCIPPAPPDLNCDDIPFRDFVVLPPDPHRFDGNRDGLGCQT